MSHEKCNCKHYGGDDHRAPLIKLDLPEYEDDRHGGASHVVLRTIRLIGYVTVLALLFYSLWRIRAIESKLEIEDKWANLTHLLQIGKRTSRSIQDQMLMNAFGNEKGTMGKGNEPVPSWKRPTNKSEFDELVNDLFDKIKAMHDDADRGHFDRNMKAVFQAWFPVFDALLPKELKEDAETRKTRDLRAVEEYFYRPRHERSSESGSDEESDKTKKEENYSSDESEGKDNKQSVEDSSDDNELNDQASLGQL